MNIEKRKSVMMIRKVQGDLMNEHPELSPEKHQENHDAYGITDGVKGLSLKLQPNGNVEATAFYETLGSTVEIVKPNYNGLLFKSKELLNKVIHIERKKLESDDKAEERDLEQLDNFINEHYSRDNEKEQLIDLMSDALHLAHQKGENVELLLSMARVHFNTEVDHDE